MDYKFRSGDMTLSYDPGRKCSAWQTVTALLQHVNDKPLFRVTFASGRHVTVTEDHSLVTMADDSWELREILPSQLIEGVTRCPLVFAEHQTTTSEFSQDDGFLDGLYLAEGCLIKQAGLVSIAVTPDARRKEVARLILKTRGIRVHAGTKDCIFTDHELKARWLSDFGKYSGGKHIHDRVFGRSLDYLRGLVAGYMAGDGCLWSDGNGAVQLCGVTISERLRDDLIFVLQLLGIFATAWDAPRNYIKPEWTDAYGFRVLSSHIHRLRRWFFYKDRNQKLRAKLKRNYRASLFEVVPFPPKVKKAVYCGFKGAELQEMYRAKHHGYVSKWRLAKHSGSAGLWARSDILWDVVVSVTLQPHENVVYDLEVAGSETFAVNNGLLVHNSSIHSTPLVKAGDRVTKGAALARSNFTDDKGTLALGANMLTGLLAYKGFTMDDAIALSESAAKKLSAVQAYTVAQKYDSNVRGGKDHFTAIFPETFKRAQLDNLDDDGVVKIGSILQPGDPIMLATSPRVASSKDLGIGNLSKSFKSLRQDATQTWDGHDPARIINVARAKDGTAKVLLEFESPARIGDKGVFRAGQKGVVSHIIPDAHMPRTADGRPLEILLNPTSIPSRSNNATLFELLMGKVAQKQGAPIKLSSYTPPGVRRIDMVMDALKQAGLESEEEIYDPIQNKKLAKPVMVGNGYFMRLHHTAESKTSSRGQAAYDANEQPQRGGQEGGASKRRSGLEVQTLMSAGAYANLREGATLTGQRNDEFWRQVRAGHQPKPPGKPFIWDKFRALLTGAGYRTHESADGRKMRIGPFTDRHLAENGPLEVQKGDMVHLNTLEPVKGGLFDPALTSTGKFGAITLPEPMPNPAHEDALRILLGFSKNQMRDIMAGRINIDGSPVTPISNGPQTSI